MKLPPVFAVDTSKTDEVVIHIDVAGSPDAFDGHFPGNPILPGVVQIDWAVRFAALHLNITKLAARDFQVKFRNIIRPGNALFLTLRLDSGKDRLSFEYKSDRTIMSSGQMKLSNKI